MYLKGICDYLIERDLRLIEEIFKQENPSETLIAEELFLSSLIETVKVQIGKL